MSSAGPLVTVLTPVYNGGRYLAECIDSVLNQNYRNWEYILINNCSTDETFSVASRYAAIDPRIRVVNNSQFVDVIENYNISFRYISSSSKYCKSVSADDWISPDCLIKMVALAEENKTVGIVGSYQLSNNRLRWKGLPTNMKVISGREVCRLSFLDNLDVFGTPTSSLYKSELIRNKEKFFPHSLPYADTSACYENLINCDYGFVHEILSTERVHSGQVSAKQKTLDEGNIAGIDHLLKYGTLYLSKEEFIKKRKDLMRVYYRWLGGCVLKMKGVEFWRFYSTKFKEFGYPINITKVLRASVEELLEEGKHPKVAAAKGLRVIEEKLKKLLIEDKSKYEI